MKIRTDFVTNSSSSSYVLDIVATEKSGRMSRVHLGSAGEEDGDSEVDFTCAAEDLLKAENFEELRKILCDAFYDEYEEYEDEDGAAVESPFPTAREELKRWLDGLEESVGGDLGKISQIAFTKTWSAWGEGCSCFDCNAEDMAPGFLEAAEKAASPDADEEDVKAFADYCENFPGEITSEWGGRFPSGFMKCGNGKARLVYEADAREEAEKVCKGSFASNDSAEEEVIADFEKKKATYDGRYSLDS